MNALYEAWRQRQLPKWLEVKRRRELLERFPHLRVFARREDCLRVEGYEIVFMRLPTEWNGRRYFLCYGTPEEQYESQ